MHPATKSFLYSAFIAILAVVVIICSFSSCLTLKQRERVCATCPTNTIIKDSIRIKIVEKTREVIIHDTLKIIADNPCKEMCDSLGKLKKGFKKTLRSDKGTTTILEEKDGKLDIEEDLTGLKTKGTFKDTTIEKYHSKFEQVPQCFREHRTSFDGFCRWFFYIIAPALLLAGFLKLKKII